MLGTWVSTWGMGSITPFIYVIRQSSDVFHIETVYVHQSRACPSLSGNCETWNKDWWSKLIILYSVFHLTLCINFQSFAWLRNSYKDSGFSCAKQQIWFHTIIQKPTFSSEIWIYVLMWEVQYPNSITNCVTLGHFSYLSVIL